MWGLPYKLVGEALQYAITHHKGQFRKDNVTEYVIHPIGVADIVHTYGGNQDQIIAALFHDILEDCRQEGQSVAEMAQDMQAFWGENVTKLVVALTNTSKTDRPDLNRAERKALDGERLAKQSTDVHLVKLADILYNVNDLESFTPGFARKFLGEKRMQVEKMTAGWDVYDYTVSDRHINLRNACYQTIAQRLAGLSDA